MVIVLVYNLCYTYSLTKLKHLKDLRFSDSDVNDGVLRLIGELRSLERLELHWLDITRIPLTYVTQCLFTLSGDYKK